MKTLLMLHSYAGANDIVARHWPWYIRSGCDILGVGRVDSKSVWPAHPGFIGSVNLGFDAHAVGDNLVRRCLDSIELFLREPGLSKYSSLCISEYDGIFLKPLPPCPSNVLRAKHVGKFNSTPGLFSPWCAHGPWEMDRPTAERIIRMGRKLLDLGIIEKGCFDQFIGLVCHLDDIRFFDTKKDTYSRNSLDSPESLEEAKAAIKAGAWYVHGVKTKEQLDFITGA